MAYMTPISFDEFVQLECARDMSHYDRCITHSEIRELMCDGSTAFEKHGSFQPEHLYENVLAACREMGFQISEFDKHWSISGGGSGTTVFLAFTEAIRKYWARYEKYVPIRWENLNLKT